LVQALPLVDTPVVDTESFCARKNPTYMIRQSAVAAEVIAVVAISAASPVFSIMSCPHNRDVPTSRKLAWRAASRTFQMRRHCTVMSYVRVEHPDPPAPRPQTLMAYRSTPLNPDFGAYLNCIAPIWLKVPLLGRETMAPEVIWSVEKLRIRVVHAAPPVDTPVVDTESF